MEFNPLTVLNEARGTYFRGQRNPLCVCAGVNKRIRLRLGRSERAAGQKVNSQSDKSFNAAAEQDTDSHRTGFDPECFCTARP